MPRVCWIFEFPTVSGGENSLLACAEAIRTAGFEICALAPAAGHLAEVLAHNNVPVTAFQVRDAATNAKRPQEQLRAELLEILPDSGADLVHANSLAMSRLVAPVTQESRIPSLGHLRDILRLSAAAIGDLNKLDRVIAVSAATRDCHVQQGLDPRKCFVSHNGIDLELFQPRKASGWLHAELGLPKDVLLVAAIGQLVIRKGHDVFLQAAAQIAERCTDAYFLLLGERYSGKDEAIRFYEDLEASINRGPLAGRAQMLGYRHDTRQILNELSLLVHTARQEPLGRVLIEAAACGLPVIATDVGGTREIFPSETDSAVLVSIDDVDAVAEIMRTLLEDPARRQQLAGSARERARSGFDIQQAAPRLVQHYKDVASMCQR